MSQLEKNCNDNQELNWRNRKPPDVYRKYTRYTISKKKYKRYHDAITSYGIILYTFVEENDKRIPYFLISQRRDTISFIEFMKGNHSSFNLPIQFSRMTPEERSRFSKYSFDQIWDDLWLNKTLKIYTQDYSFAKNRYQDIFKDIPKLLRQYPSQTQYPEWGFPKGKRHRNETEISCAVREFSEETCYSSKNIKVKNEKYVETFRGTNYKLYKTVYFPAEVSDKLPIVYQRKEHGIRKSTISEEIGDLKWVTFEEAKEYLNPVKYQLIKKLYYRIKPKD